MKHGNISVAALLLCAVISFSSEVHGAAAVSVVPTGSSSFTVQGTGMEGVAGIQLDIGYDAASLEGTPTVTQGSAITGAMFAANVTRPGHIKIAVISSATFSASGQIATISFAAKTGGGGITSVTTTMIDKTGTLLPSTAGSGSTETAVPEITSSPAAPAGQPGSTVPVGQAGQPTTLNQPAAATTPVYPGTVTMPADQQQGDTPPSPAEPAATVPAEPAAVVSAEQTPVSDKAKVDTKAEETPQYVVYKGILERFNRYKGSRKLAAIAALFEKPVAQTVRQEPAILISDGAGRVSLTVDLPARISSSPNFAVLNGMLVSFRQDKLIKNRWYVDVLPESGSLRVTLTIIAGAEEFEYPLTVAPPVKTVLTLDEAGWNRFLNEAGTEKAPRHDMNADGVRDYVDEYIFAANIFAKKASPALPAAEKAPNRK